MVGNLFAHIVERNPLSRARELVFVNNVVYNRGNDGRRSAELEQPPDAQLDRGQRVPAWPELQPRHAPDLRAHQRHVHACRRRSRVYQTDNYAPESGSTAAQLLQFTGGAAVGLLVDERVRCGTRASPRVRPRTTPCTTACCSYAGARPTDRDSVDKRIVNTVKNRNGRSSIA